MAKEFITVKRVYVNKGEKAINSQTVSVRSASIVAVRASNRLGYPEHRSTITLSTGRDMDLALTVAQVRALLVIAA